MSDWSPERIAALIGALIPVVTALAAHVQAAEKVRAWIAMILAFIAGPLASFIQTNEDIISWTTAQSAFFAWLVALLTYLAAWKPILAINARVLPQLGVGKPKS